MESLNRYCAQLDQLKSRGVYRHLRASEGADFASNDYLGLAASEEMTKALIDALGRGVPIGSGGSRLLRGNHPEHEGLEEYAAQFFGAERALLFGSGYAANTALLSTLPQREDLVVYDEYVHASVHDGMKLGRASCVPFPHNDTTAAEDVIGAWRARGGSGTAWIVVESVYSMEGDLAPLRDFKALAERTAAFLIIDEAHATGVFGTEGRGLAAEFEGLEYILTLHTGGKALGVSGALVAGPAVLCDFLINRARPFIFATAPAPLVAVALRQSLRILREQPQRRARLAALVDYARESIGERLGVPASRSQILPIIVGESGPAMRIAQEIQAAGFDVRAIRPPTVPAGTARLRVSITLNVDEAAIDGLSRALERALGAHRGHAGAP